MLFKPGTLRRLTENATVRALDSGSLLPIDTEETFITQEGVTFLVRILSSLALKELEQRRHEAAASQVLEPMNRNSGTVTPRNPFLPHDPALFVADVSETHLGLLNKYPVIDHHLLIVTRQFEDQEQLLSRADFDALWTCLSEFNGLGFYNGGVKAGASQPHKHLQLVPLPLSHEGLSLPIHPLLELLPPGSHGERLPPFPFPHATARLAPDADADTAHQCFLNLLRHVGLPPHGEGQQPGSYNLLMQRDWMLVVPRSSELSHGISVNALGFAGSLFVKNHEDLQRLREIGPMTLLTEVCARP